MPHITSLPSLPALLGVCLQETLAERKAARRAERDALARGEMPETLKKWRVGCCCLSVSLGW